MFHGDSALAAVGAHRKPDGQAPLDIACAGSAQCGQLQQSAAAALDQNGYLVADHVLEGDLMVCLGGIAQDECRAANVFEGKIATEELLHLALRDLDSDRSVGDAVR